MAQIDWKINYQGETYYCRGSSTTDVFYSPIFKNLEDYKNFIKSKPLFEYEDIVIDDDTHTQSKKAINTLLSGQIPSQVELQNLFSLYYFCLKLGEAQQAINTEEDIINQMAKLSITVDDFKQKYTSIHDLLYKEHLILVNDPNYLKLAGWYLQAVFTKRKIFDNLSLPKLYNFNVRPENKT